MITVLNLKDAGFRYYLHNKEKLNRRYTHQYVLIRGEVLLGACNSYTLAEDIARKMFPDKDYYVQFCH